MKDVNYKNFRLPPSLLASLITYIVFFLLPANTFASTTQTKAELSFQSCSAVANELLTVIQLYQNHFALEELLKSLPEITPKGQTRVRDLYTKLENEGVVSVYSKVNSAYSQCAKQAYKKNGIPAADTMENGYYFCAGENKVRYEIVLAIYLNAPEEKVIPQLQEQHQNIGRHYYQLARQSGIESVFNELASSHKSCTNQLYIATPH
ncbi:MAG: hypothetical protein H7A00_08740 [Hahellaceae bacterium]|nr:hypothetical protein [Hahellaceae bacterium]